VELRSLPWQQAAQRLIAFLETTDDTQRALAVLNLLCRRFGDHGYPGFLKLLLIIGNSAATLAKQRLSDAIALGLQRGNVLLSESTYHECVVTLLGLFNYSRAARELYPLKIAADLTGIEGAFAHQTRRSLEALAESWRRDLSVEQIASSAVDSGEP
jgi:hypothetical protein